MSIFDAFLTILIGLYVMVGGALLNAAFTAPANCKKFLDYLTPDHHERLAQVLYILAPVLALIGVHRVESGPLGGNPALWLALAHVGLFLVLVLCKKIVRIVLKPDTSEQ